MSAYGKIKVKFSKPIIVPEKVSDVLLDHLLRIYVQSNNDDSIFLGSFSQSMNQRRMQGLDLSEVVERDNFAFDPKVSKMTESEWEIDLNFREPKKLSLDNQARYKIEILEPSILRSKQVYEPLSDLSFRNNKLFSEGPVPA